MNLEHPIYFSVTFSVEINTTDVTYGWNGDTVGYRVYYQHFSTEQIEKLHSIPLTTRVSPLVAFQNIKRTFLGRPFRHCIPTNVTNNYPQARSLMTRDQQTSPARLIREDGGMSLNKRLLGDLIKGRQVYDASYHQADCNFRLLIGR